MITLGSVTLPDALVWVDRSALGAVAITSKRRFDGGLAVRAQALAGGRTITLEVPADVTITRANQLALEGLAAVAGATYALSIPQQGYSATVVITALDLRAVIDYADPDDADPVAGTIQLMTV